VLRRIRKGRKAEDFQKKYAPRRNPWLPISRPQGRGTKAETSPGTKKACKDEEKEECKTESKKRKEAPSSGLTRWVGGLTRMGRIKSYPPEGRRKRNNHRASGCNRRRREQNQSQVIEEKLVLETHVAGGSEKGIEGVSCSEVCKFPELESGRPTVT